VPKYYHITEFICLSTVQTKIVNVGPGFHGNGGKGCAIMSKWWCLRYACKGGCVNRGGNEKNEKIKQNKKKKNKNKGEYDVLSLPLFRDRKGDRYPPRTQRASIPLTWVNASLIGNIVWSQASLQLLPLIVLGKNARRRKLTDNYISRLPHLLIFQFGLKEFYVWIVLGIVSPYKMIFLCGGKRDRRHPPNRLLFCAHGTQSPLPPLNTFKSRPPFGQSALFSLLYSLPVSTCPCRG